MLVIGDTHIPERASKLPDVVEEFITSQTFDVVACTGDLTGRNVLELLSSLAKKMFVVRGNMDHLPLPEYEVIDAGELRIGLIHGNQVYPRGNRNQLIRIAKKMGVNVLISGHTHSPDIYLKDVLLLNPGSATGVWGGGNASLTPSFMILNIDGPKIDVELYEDVDGLRCVRKENLIL